MSDSGQNVKKFLKRATAVVALSLGAIVGLTSISFRSLTGDGQSLVGKDNSNVKKAIGLLGIPKAFADAPASDGGDAGGDAPPPGDGCNCQGGGDGDGDG